MKKISVIISIVAFIALAYWAFHAFVNRQQFIFDPLSVVPEDALLIAEIGGGGKDAATFYQRSMIWKDFEDTPFAKEAKPFFQLLDSLHSYNNIVVSLHKGEIENNALITISDPNNKLKNLLVKYGAEKDKVASSFIYHISGIPYLFDVQDQYIQIAKSRDFLVRSKNFIEQDRSILQDSSFIAIRPGFGSGNSLKLLINLESFTKSLNKKITEDIYDFPEKLSGWLVTDLYDKANTIVSSGFLNYNTTEDNFFDHFDGQIAQGLHYFDVIPANTAILTASGYSNPSNYLKTIAADKEQIKYFSSWLGNAYGSGVLNGDRDLSELRFAFFELSDEESFNDRSHVYIDEEYSTLRYKDHTIQKFDSLFTFSGFAEGIEEIKRPYFSILKNYVIFSGSEETLKEIIKRYTNDNTLSLQESFSNLRDELSDETNYLFYISPAMADSFLKKELADSLRNYWLPNEEKVNSLQALIVQVSTYKKGKMYVHSALRHQVVNFQEKDNSLWEVYLDKAIKGNIHLLRNHYTQHLEIAVQDSSNTLYILNNKGEVLWKKMLDGVILGDIKQVDIYKNGKLQILFNTSKTLYCMDRKGNDLEKFPIAFSQEASLPVSLFDYDSNKNYRILAGFPNGEMDMYDMAGNKLNGWKFKKVRSAISESPQHFRIGKKDYIYTSTGNGTILLLDRKGKSRYKAKANIGDKIGAANIYTGRSIAESGIYYIDTLGAVVHLPFGGEKEYLAIKGENGDQLYMARVNADNSREFILYNHTKIEVYDVNGNKLFEKINLNNLGWAPQKYRFEQQNWLGYTDNYTKEAYLKNVNGANRNDAPYAGVGPFRIGDINKDGIYELIIQGENGQLVVYSLTK